MNINLTADNSIVNINTSESFNKGQSNLCLLKSIKTLGAGRSIVVDADNNVVCGGKVLDACVKAGINKAIIVETAGDELVVVRRLDLKKGDVNSLMLNLIDNVAHDQNVKYDSNGVRRTMLNNAAFDPTVYNAHEVLVEELDISELIRDELVKQTNRQNKIQSDESVQISLFE